jgi:hypothetical protein
VAPCASGCSTNQTLLHLHPSYYGIFVFLFAFGKMVVGNNGGLGERGCVVWLLAFKG